MWSKLGPTARTSFFCYLVFLVWYLLFCWLERDMRGAEEGGFICGGRRRWETWKESEWMTNGWRDLRSHVTSLSFTNSSSHQLFFLLSPYSSHHYSSHYQDFFSHTSLINRKWNKLNNRRVVICEINLGQSRIPLFFCLVSVVYLV